MGTNAGAARRRIHLATVLLRPPSGHRPGRRQARHAHILQIGPRLAIDQADATSVIPYPSDRTPPYAITKRVDSPSTWTSPSDLDRKESDGRDPPQGVEPHAHRGVIGAPELCR